MPREVYIRGNTPQLFDGGPTDVQIQQVNALCQPFLHEHSGQNPISSCGLLRALLPGEPTSFLITAQGLRFDAEFDPATGQIVIKDTKGVKVGEKPVADEIQDFEKQLEGKSTEVPARIAAPTATPVSGTAVEGKPPGKAPATLAHLPIIDDVLIGGAMGLLLGYAASRIWMPRNKEDRHHDRRTRSVRLREAHRKPRVPSLRNRLHGLIKDARRGDVDETILKAPEKEPKETDSTPPYDNNTSGKKYVR